MTTGSDYSVTARAGAMRTPPNAHDTEGVTTSIASLDLAVFGDDEVDLRGKWVFFTARGAAVTLRRFVTGATAPTITAGVGFTIADGKTEELWVPSADSGAGTSLRVIGDGSGNLDADYSDD